MKSHYILLQYAFRIVMMKNHYIIGDNISKTSVAYSYRTKQINKIKNLSIYNFNEI